jgi:UDP-N-acetylglucosamine 4,6-dehydratase
MTLPPPDASANTIVVTGGTGSFGSAFTRFLLETTSLRVRVLSRDEHKQESMMRGLPAGPRLTYILADVRDARRLRQACDGAWAVVHAAALKTVPLGERQADEFVETNVNGSRNVISAALEAGVKRSLLISSDKAVSPINLYGKTKAVAESLFTQANVLGVSRGCNFAVVRGGNVWASNGSVATMWRGKPYITVYDPTATRFNLCMPDWTAFVYQALSRMWGGEIFAPIAPAWNLGDLASALPGSDGAIVSIRGPRPGDKPHETLVSADEALRTVTTDWCHVIEPPEALRQVWKYEPWVGERLASPYTSDTARRMSVDELRELWTE